MASITDVASEFVRREIEEFVERPDERQRLIDLFRSEEHTSELQSQR